VDDLGVIALAFGLFSVAAATVRACERLLRGGQEEGGR
jgi:hypothetical protein